MSTPLASPWIPTCILCVLVVVTRAKQRSWIAPSVFTSSIWFLYILIPLVVAPEYRVSALAVWLLLLFVASMVCGAMITENKTRNVSAPSLSVPFLLRWILLCSAVSLVGGLYAAAKAVHDYGLALTLSGFMGVGHFLAVERYGGEQTPTLVRLLVAWMYPAALLAGMTYALARSRRQRILCFSALLPALMFSLVEAAKANTLIAIALAAGGYLAMRVRTGTDRFRPANKSTILLLVVSIPICASLFFVVDLFRSHTDAQQQSKTETYEWGRIKSTAVGYLGVFSDWVDRPEGLNSMPPSLGVYTVGGLFDVVGLHARQTGVYETLVNLDLDNDSNIYTAFRGLIEDFSFPGALVACILLGCVSGFAYKASSLGHSWAVITLAAFYAFLFWSPIGSIFIYNGPILAVVLAGFLLKKATKYTPAKVISGYALPAR